MCSYLGSVNLPAYLDRIAYSGPTEPTPETLRNLHRAHLLAVPFENLDIGIRRKIICDETAFIRKIVEHGNGADRQLRVFKETGDLTKVVDYIIQETESSVDDSAPQGAVR